jgi:hypothetical protein
MSADDQRLYNPGRDVAHNFKSVMETVADRLEKVNTWKELDVILKQEKISDADLGEACAAYCRYLVAAADDASPPMWVALEAAGFFKTKGAAQVAVMAMIGTVYCGMHHVGVQEATLGGVGPLLSERELVQRSIDLLDYMRYPRWRRKLKRLSQRISNAFRAMKS